MSFLAVGKKTNSKVMMERTQPMGQIKYRNVRLGTSGKMKYTQINRLTHMNRNVATVADTGLPIPRRAAPKISLIPQIK